MTQGKLEIAAALALTLTALVILTVRLTGASEPSQAMITAHDAWARPTPGKARNGAVYVTVRNSGNGAGLITAVQADVSESVELHRTIQDNGVMRMRAVEDGVEVPAGGTAMFKPGGYHIMLLGLKAPLKEGESFPLTLELNGAGSVEVEVKVTANPPGEAVSRGSSGGQHKH